MARLSRVAKAKQLMAEGKSDAEIVAETGLYLSKVSRIRSGESKGPKDDLTPSDFPSLSLDAAPDKIIIPKAQDKESQPRPQVFDITSVNETQSNKDSSGAASGPELEKFRQYLAKNVSRFEGALFKVLAEEDMPREEREMLEESWTGLFRCVIKDTNMEMALALMLVATAHGTVYLMHQQEIHKGITRIRNRRQERLEKPQENKPSPPPGNGERLIKPEAQKTIPASRASAILLPKDSLRDV